MPGSDGAARGNGPEDCVPKVAFFLLGCGFGLSPFSPLYQVISLPPLVRTAPEVFCVFTLTTNLFLGLLGTHVVIASESNFTCSRSSQCDRPESGSSAS